MSSELSILALYGLFTMLTILVQTLAAQSQVGLLVLARSREDMPVLVGIAGRLNRAQSNAVIAMALFAPAVLILAVQDGGFTPGTLLACQIFLIARVVYAAVYAAGLPWIRTVAWVSAFFCTGYLYLVAL